MHKALLGTVAKLIDTLGLVIVLLMLKTIKDQTESAARLRPPSGSGHRLGADSRRSLHGLLKKYREWCGGGGGVGHEVLSCSEPCARGGSYNFQLYP